MDKYQFREIVLDVRKSNSDQRVISATLSSEVEIERVFGIEILSHEKDAIDLSRARNGIALLFGHNQDEPPIGTVTQVRIENKKLKGELRFGNTTRAKELWEDVQEGILNSISIGYRINKAIEDGERDGVPIFRVIDWTLLEVSLVSVPADASVGIGRSNTRRGYSKMSNEDKHMTRSQRKFEKQKEKEEKDRIDAIRKIGELFDEESLALEFIAEGRSIDDFNKATLEKMSTDSRGWSFPDLDAHGCPVDYSRHSGFAPSEQKYSILRAAGAQITGDWSEAKLELEVSKRLGKELGKKPQGVFIPMGDFTRAAISKSGDGASLVGVEHMPSEFIDILREKSRVISLGAKMMNGLVQDVSIPRKTSGSSVGWVTEGTDVGEGGAVFDSVTMSPKTVGAFVDLTRKMILQSAPESEQLIRMDLAEAISTELDRAAINGSGTGAEPEGILNKTGLGLVPIGANGGAPTWDHVVDLNGELADVNADVGMLAYLTNSKVRTKLLKTEKFSGTNGVPIWEPGNNEDGRIAGFRAAVSNNVPSDLTKGTGTNLSAILFGNWSDIIIAQWGVLDVIVDQYSLAKSGGVRIVALMDVDIQVRRIQSFAAIVDADTT